MHTCLHARALDALARIYPQAVEWARGIAAPLVAVGCGSAGFDVCGAVPVGEREVLRRTDGGCFAGGCNGEGINDLRSIAHDLPCESVLNELRKWQARRQGGERGTRVRCEGGERCA